MKFSKFVLTAALVSAAMASHAVTNPNLIKNGDFESYTGGLFSGYANVLIGSTAISGWTVTGTSVDVIQGAYGAIDSISIDMLGTPGPGTLSQSFDSVIGQNYLVSFDLGANTSQLDDGALSVSFGSSPVHTFSGTPTVTRYSFNVQADSASTLLSFASRNISANGGPVLDNVSVTAVPEPETYAMLLAGLGLMGTIARRRNKKQA
jgi:choice-of-anchor C domain-containing protein